MCIHVLMGSTFDNYTDRDVPLYTRVLCYTLYSIRMCQTEGEGVCACNYLQTSCTAALTQVASAFIHIHQRTKL